MSGDRPGNPALAAKTAHLREILREVGPVLVAFSGGVDSAVLLAMAREVLGGGVVAVTAVSPSLPGSERQEARRVAREIGADQVELPTAELEDPRYRANDPDRCAYCKEALLLTMEAEAARRGGASIIFGANLDDSSDYRPGMKAARRRGARAPLLEAGFTKADVRALARHLGLSVWDKPARACLASRIPFGTEVTVERLARVERAEEVLAREGFRQFRVRDHGEVARLEIAPAEMDRLSEAGLRRRLAEAVREAGFRYVALDLEGYRSGSLNPEEAPETGPASRRD